MSETNRDSKRRSTVVKNASIPEADRSPRPIQRRLMLPLAVVLLLLVGGIVATLVHTQREGMAQSSQERLARASLYLGARLEQQAQALSAIEDVLLCDADLADALKARDRDRLLADYEGIFTQLRMDHGITHFYFHRPDRVNLLRVHSPDRAGDLIGRFTALEAERTGETASGIELGPLGTFTLRVVRPVFDGDALIGYLELGKEIEDILESIAKEQGIEIAISIQKCMLDRTKWETGMEMLDRSGDWEQFPKDVLIYCSLPLFPPECDRFVDESGHTDRDVTAETDFGGKTWRVLIDALYDVSGAEVGDMIVLQDISTGKAMIRRLLLASGGSALTVFASLFVLLRSLLRRTDRAMERQQVELREGEARLQNVLDSASQISIIATDRDGLITLFNAGAERMLSYTADEMVGRKTPATIHLESEVVAHGKELSEEYGRPVEGFEVFTLKANEDGYEEREWTYVRKDGTELQVNLGVTSIHGETGEITGLLGVGLDISERKRAEDELRQTNTDLEQQTGLANSMAAEAVTANAAKSEFLANMSHEIRTPMNGVIGMSGLLLDTDLTPDQRMYAETVRNSGDSLLGLINDILDFSKIEAGKLEMEILDFDLRTTLENFGDALAMRAHDKGLEFNCLTNPDVPALLRGDPGRLRQILTNLSGNAIKFTERGEIAVVAELVSENDTHATVRFSVRDTGIGIPKNRQEELFEAFTQADGSTTRKYGGTGLGLTISKQLAELMGGEIGVESVEGEGATFWFSGVFEKQPPGAQPPEPPPHDIADKLEGLRILAVDDNVTNRQVVGGLLESWRFRHDEVADGRTALERLGAAIEQGDPYRLAILDMQMPEMDGEELARQIKADPDLGETRLVLMTSLGQRGDAARMEEIGFEGYLPKPIKQSILFDCLATILTGKAREKGEERKALITRHSIAERRRTNVRILLAEDNITNQEVALGILKKLGFSADAVANGAETVKALEAIPYDLVLMDMQMPEMDGMEATACIRDQQSAVLDHDVPIIALTANAMQGDREKCLEAGMNDYVPKPVTPQALAEALDEWLPEEQHDEGGGAKMEGQRMQERDGAESEEGETAPVFDKAAFLERMMDDEDLARTVAMGFLGDIPRQIESLKAYLGAGDASGSERQAHTIKGASANVGGEALREVAFDMEKAAKAGNLDLIRNRVPELETQFDRLKEAMKNEFQD